MKLTAKTTAENVTLTLAEKAGEYWGGSSKNAKALEGLVEKLVPAKGEANSVHGMLLRAANNIYYDVYNNGGLNMVDNIHDDWLEEGDEGYKEPEYELVGLFKDFFENLERFMPKEHQDCVRKTKEQVLENPDSSCIIFDHLVDRVVHTVLTTNNIVQEAAN